MNEEKKVITVLRLEARQYAELEKRVGHIQIDGQTSELQAAYQLGIQQVLKVLRQGYVIGTD